MFVMLLYTAGDIDTALEGKGNVDRNIVVIVGLKRCAYTTRFSLQKDISDTCLGHMLWTQAMRMVVLL